MTTLMHANALAGIFNFRWYDVVKVADGVAAMAS